MLRCLALLAVTGCVDLGSEPWDPGAEAPSHGEPQAGAAAPGSEPVGAGGAGGGEADAGPPGADAEVAACDRSSGAQTVDVLLVANAIRPHRVEICAGDTVRWTNRDTKEHTIMSGTPDAPDGRIASGKIYLGETYSYTFDDPGTVLYYCSTHKKKMRDAQVVVR